MAVHQQVDKAPSQRANRSYRPGDVASGGKYLNVFLEAVFDLTSYLVLPFHREWN